jgi:Domain of unknown function (DUF4149)
MRLLPSLYRLLAAALLGAQLFFAAVAAQKVFPKEVAALPRSEPRRVLAADLVGQMLGVLDPATMVCSALCACLAVLLRRAGEARLLAALPPLLVALCAAASAFGTTPAIQAMRAAGATGEPRFGMLHGISSSLLVLEMLLLLWASLRPL